MAVYGLQRGVGPGRILLEEGKQVGKAFTQHVLGGLGPCLPEFGRELARGLRLCKELGDRPFIRGTTGDLVRTISSSVAVEVIEPGSPVYRHGLGIHPPRWFGPTHPPARCPKVVDSPAW